MEDDRRARRRARHDARHAAEENIESASESAQEDDSVEAQIRRRVEKRLKQRDAFIRHLVSFIAVNAMLWAIWAVTSGGFPWPIFVTLGWGIGLVSDGLQVYQNSTRVAIRREEGIQREIELEKQRLGLADEYEKPKRERTMRLSDDGELVPSEEDDDDGLVSKAKRGQHPLEQMECHNHDRGSHQAASSDRRSTNRTGTGEMAHLATSVARRTAGDVCLVFGFGSGPGPYHCLAA